MKQCCMLLMALLTACAFRTIPPMTPPPGMSGGQAELLSGECAQWARDKNTHSAALRNAVTGGILAAMMGAANGAAIGAAFGDAAYGAKLGAAANGPSGFLYGAMMPSAGIVNRREMNKDYFHCMLRVGFIEVRR